MVRIRLKRCGSKNEPHWRIVVADIKSPRDGRFIEEIGAYNSLRAKDNLKLKTDRLEYWVTKGAQMSESVRTLVKRSQRIAKKAA